MTTNDFEKSNDATSQGVVHPTTSSLAISTNLDSMLEHDNERTRRSPNSFSSTRSSPLFQSSHSPTFLTGLPPPPRSSRRVGSRSTIPREPDTIGPWSRPYSDATGTTFLPLGPSTSEPDASYLFINAVPELVRNDGSSDHHQIFTCPTAPGIPNSPWVDLDHVVDSTTSNPIYGPNLPASVRSYDTPAAVDPEEYTRTRTDRDGTSLSSRTHIMLPVEKVIGAGESMLTMPALQTQIGSLPNSTGEELQAAGLDRLRKFSDSPSLPGPSVTVLRASNRSTRNIDEASSTVSSRSADEPKIFAQAVLSHDREGSPRRWSHPDSSESRQYPIATPMLRTISISDTGYTPSYLDTQNRALSGPPSHLSAPDDSDEYNYSSNSTSPSSIEFAACTGDHSPTSPIARVPRPKLYTYGRSDVPQSRRDRSPIWPISSSGTSYSKPPLPTTSKPNFGRPASANSPSNSPSRRPSPNPNPYQSSPKTGERSLSPMPPTTNFLDPQARTDLVKKSRKLAQVFGTTPGVAAYDDLQSSHLALPALLPFKPEKRQDVHGASLMPGIFRPSLDDSELKPSRLIVGDTQYFANGRRHSVPFSPDGVSFLQDDMAGTEAVNDFELFSSSMDMSTESISNDCTPTLFSVQTPNQGGRRLGIQNSSSTPSLADTCEVAEREEADRKRKRDQLAKLHRFLGSRVPVGLVLGLDAGDDSSLPPLALQVPDSGGKSDKTTKNAEPRRAWLSRRRSSSSAVYPMTSHDLDRLKENLSDEEKAINVRRALKMEKVFGVLPPQSLYHTRCSPSPIHRPASPAIPSFGRWTAPPSPISRSRNQSQLFERNSNQSAYKSKVKKHYRPGTPESVQRLLSHSSGSFDFESQSSTMSDVYTHYQHSLHSLNDIIDRGDRASLMELRQYMQGEVPDPLLQNLADHSDFVSGSIKSERRRSLPSPVLSMSTVESSLPTSKPETADFQLRRRRAAKLTQFFGVDYNQIIRDVLESIEKGVEEERKRGALQPKEVEVLLQKVHTLKTKQSINL